MEWDLSVLYTGFDDPRIEADFQRLRDAIARAQAQAEQLTQDDELLSAYLCCSEEMAMLNERLGSFAMLTLATDALNEPANAMLDKLMQLTVSERLADSAMVRRIGAMPDVDGVIARTPALQNLKSVLLRARDEARHLLPEQAEKWMLRMQLSGGQAFSNLRDKLDGTLMVDYDGKSIPLSEARNLAYDPSPDVRRAAYQAELKSYKKVEIPMAAALCAIKSEARTLAEARGFDSVLSMVLNETHMDMETLRAMLDAINEYLPHFRRFLRHKARLLGHENGLPFYDLFAPMSHGDFTPRVYTLSQARAALERELANFDPAMARFVGEAFDNRWIDAFPHEGKGGGAFCADLHQLDQSRVLTNFIGSYGDVSTLAHELGHAWHNRQMKGLSPLLANPPMPLAETASIFNETLLAASVMKSTGEGERFSILENSITDATQTVVDILSRYLFETRVVDTCADRTMSAEELKAAMLDAQAQTYGDGLSPDERHPYMWACKSHYYSTGVHFYNFPYAFGLLFGKGVYALYEKEGAPFAARYNALLRVCGSMPIYDVAASVGINVHDVGFWRASLDVVRRDIDAFIDMSR